MPNTSEEPSSPTTQDLLQLYVQVVQLVEQWRAQQLAEIDRDYRHMLALESALLEWTIDDWRSSVDCFTNKTAQILRLQIVFPQLARDVIYVTASEHNLRNR